MACPRCGHAGHFANGCCPSCGAVVAQTSVGTGVVPFDTTGLPEGATFGPTVAPEQFQPATAGGTRAGTGAGTGIGTGAGTGMGTGAGTGMGTGAGTGTGTGELGAAAARRGGPLKVGQAFGPRYHIIKL